MIRSRGVAEGLRYDGEGEMESCGGRTVEYRVRIYTGPRDTVVLLSDRSDSIYSSITLHTEELAEAIACEFGLDRRQTRWIEHIPQDRRLGRDEDLYDLVHFGEYRNRFAHPIWTPLDADEVLLLIGESVAV